MKSPRQKGLVCVVLASLGLFASCDSGKSHLVATAGELELTVDDLGGIIAHGKHVPLRRDIVERMAGLWVDYALVVQRLAEGDSLLDSTTVVDAMWSERQAMVVEAYHAELIADRILLEPSAVDSAYTAGNERLIYHILVRTNPEFSSAQRDEARWKANRLHDVAEGGLEGWLRANEENEDVQSRDADGSLGIITRGGQVPGFEETAFALEPGEMSPVTESQYGFHVIWRPQLSEVWDEFEDGYRRRIEERLSAEFTRELEDSRQISVRDEAPELMRIAVENIRDEGDWRRTIGTYDGGRFTVADFVRWLQVLPVEYRAHVGEADDEQLKLFARGLMRNYVLEIEALEAGHNLSQEGFLVLKETLSQDLDILRESLSLDSVFRRIRCRIRADRGGFQRSFELSRRCN